MHKVFFSDEAMSEYYQIGAHIAVDNIFYANEVLDKIDQSIQKIQEFPFLGKKINNKSRILVEPQYKFKVVYEAHDDMIYIVSIFKYRNLWE